jgi:hypothetical protein
MIREQSDQNTIANRHQIMKIKTIQKFGFTTLLGLALLTPAALHAGGRSGKIVSNFKPVSLQELDGLGQGAAAVKVCRACRKVTLMQVHTGGRGAAVQFVSKCDPCGSEDTYYGIAEKSTAAGRK